MSTATLNRRQLRVAGLFAGIGGIELGLGKAGHSTELLCELDPWAREVLRRRFPNTQIEPDIRSLNDLPTVDLVAAGFPCQDLSLAGTQAGISGKRSGLVSHLFRLIEKKPPEFVLMENVLYLIKRQHGGQLRQITDYLEWLGYRWAYRVVDTRGFGLPQRRQRVVILASRGDVDPVDVLMSRSVVPDIDDSIQQIRPDWNYGFYWTEGKRAVGWAPQAVPTIKGGSGLGIPSPPAVFDAESRITGTPVLQDGERLQGFAPGWTDVDLDGRTIKEGLRWTLVGNAVSVPVSSWIAEELASPSEGMGAPGNGPVKQGKPMPKAASGDGKGGAIRHEVSLHVEAARHKPIGDFLDHPLKPLSERAIRGFLRRVDEGIMSLPDDFLDALDAQLCTKVNDLDQAS